MARVPGISQEGKQYFPIDFKAAILRQVLTEVIGVSSPGVDGIIEWL